MAAERNAREEQAAQAQDSRKKNKKNIDMAEKDEGGHNITEAYQMSEGFSKIHTEMDILRYKLKSDLEQVKSTMKDLENSIEFTQEEVSELKNQAQTTREVIAKRYTFGCIGRSNVKSPN